jgi:integrase
MASLCEDKGPRGTRWRVITRLPNGSRHTMRLGRVSKRIAEQTRRMVELLEASKATGQPYDPELIAWLGRISDKIHDRIVRAGLAEPRAASVAAITLGKHLDRYFSTLGKQKPTTARNYERSRRLMLEFFTKDRLLDSITPGDADEYKAWLLSRFAVASASVDLRRARQFLRQAVRRRLIMENPFADITCGSQVNESRKEFITIETIEKVIAACTSNEWRLVLALARYAGLRIPSEIKDLRWEDIDWEHDRFTVHEPKVEHHPGRGRRTIPIFPELRPHLERAYRERQPGQEFVVPMARHATNLSTEARRIIKRAGVPQWQKTFVNLRASRSDELDRAFPPHVVDRWMGHSGKVRRAHYLMVTEQDFANASSQIPEKAQKAARAAHVRGHQQPSDASETREKQRGGQEEEVPEYPRQGSNL